jgi:hypothetical protein
VQQAQHQPVGEPHQHHHQQELADGLQQPQTVATERQHLQGQGDDRQGSDLGQGLEQQAGGFAAPRGTAAGEATQQGPQQPVEHGNDRQTDHQVKRGQEQGGQHDSAGGGHSHEHPNRAVTPG